MLIMYESIEAMHQKLFLTVTGFEKDVDFAYLCKEQELSIRARSSTGWSCHV